MANSKYTLHLITALCGLFGPSSGSLPGEPRMIELTWRLENGMPHWPGMVPYNFTIVDRNVIPDGFYLELNNIYLAEHTGTHLDAPAHFIQGAWRLDQVPLQNLAGPGVVVDVRDKTRDNPDYEIGPQDFQDWEREHGRIPDGSVLMLRTGWGEWYWEQGETAYLGTDTGNTALLHFPGLHPEGAQWLADNRKMHVIGIDTGSMDNGQSVQKMSHRILLPKRVIFIENVGHLDQLPTTGSTVYAMPILIGQGSGGPARVFAIVDGRTSACSPLTATVATVLLTLAAVILNMI
ncbi:isatin hydrolase-like isoform X2 [Branchiostoma floridae x Branchiostoma belcheri]